MAVYSGDCTFIMYCGSFVGLKYDSNNDTGNGVSNNVIYVYTCRVYLCSIFFKRNIRYIRLYAEISSGVLLCDRADILFLEINNG